MPIAPFQQRGGLMPQRTKNRKRKVADPSLSAGKRRSAQTILEAAERLCATHGIEAVSIRDIAAEAGVAIAVIYHHYKSKGNLLRTILRLRFDEIKDEYEGLLSGLEGQKSPAVHDIVRALLQPLNHWRTPERQAARQFYVLALISRIPELRDDIDGWVVGLRRIVDLLRRALPHLTETDICWRLHFTMKLRHQSDLDMARLSIMSKGLCHSDDREEALVRGIAYAEAAFSGPPLNYSKSSGGQSKVRTRRQAS
jgi:AcrR family transcriptional regulator